LHPTEIKQETGYNRAEVRILDLASFSSVSAFANELEKEDARVDVLVANAAIGTWSYEVTKDGWEQR
jgi:retinol dehydrogenase 12